MSLETRTPAPPQLIWLTDRRRWTVLTGLVLAAGLLWIALARANEATTTGGAPPPSPREGFSAPDFTLERRGGGQTTLSELRGAVVVLNLWASWCPPCRAEMPALQAVHDEYADQGLVVLGLNTLFQDGLGAAEAFISEFGLTFPMVFDESGAVSQRYQLRAMPTTFFIDRRGVIRAVVVGGPMSEALLRAQVDELLAEVP